MSDAVKVDANNLLQNWRTDGVPVEAQCEKIRALLILSKPLITITAERCADLRDDDKTEGIKQVVGLLKATPEDERGYWIGRAAKLMKISKVHLQEQLRPAKKSKSDKDEGEPIPTAGGWIQHHLVELFYNPDEMRTYLAVRYPDGGISELKSTVTIEERVYRPIWPNSIMIKKTVLLPSELGKDMSEDELIWTTRLHIAKYFDFGGDKFFEEICPLYVPFTYVYDGFTEVSYLRALGDYGTGKTRFLKTIGKICYRPVYISGGGSAASIYHLLDTYRGTLVLNEGDFGQSDEASIISKILNGGTERDEGITKMRKDANGDMEVEAYNVFGPKVIGTRKEFDDRAIKSRCLTMDMVPMIPHPNIPQSLPPEKELLDLQIRNLWTTFRMKNSKENVTIDESKNDRSIEPRLNQITLSLMATIKDEGAKEKIRLFLREYNQRTREERYQDKTARVVEGLVMANAWGPVSDHPSDLKRVYLKDVTCYANMRIDEMRKMMGEEEEEEIYTKKDGTKAKKKTKLTSRSVSFVLDKFCQLQTRRTTDGHDDYRGTNEVVWDELRIKALSERWGVEWLERGSVERPSVGLDESLGWSEESKDAFKKARNEWNAAGKED
jgi:hypothetical protein